MSRPSRRLSPLLRRWCGGGRGRGGGSVGDRVMAGVAGQRFVAFGGSGRVPAAELVARRDPGAGRWLLADASFLDVRAAGRELAARRGVHEVRGPAGDRRQAGGGGLLLLGYWGHGGPPGRPLRVGGTTPGLSPRPDPAR